MNSEDKKKLIAISTVILLFVLFAWIASWRFQSIKASGSEKSNSWQSLLTNIQVDQDNLNKRLLGNTPEVKDIKTSLQEFVNKESLNWRVTNITKEVMSQVEQKKNQEQLATWVDYQSENLNFKYPATWQIEKKDNVLIAKENGLQKMKIISYAQSKNLPDNLSGSNLVVWLEQQKERQLGQWRDYQKLDWNNQYPVYQLTKRAPDQEVNLLWQGKQIDWLIYQSSLDEKIIKLIISTIN